MDQTAPANQVIFWHDRQRSKTQIWIAVYVLIAIIKKRLNLDTSLFTILQILSVTIFENITLNQLLMDNEFSPDHVDSPNQLILFD